MAAHTGALSATIEAARRADPATAILALAITAGSMLISGAVWARVLHCLGCRASLRLGLAVYAGTGLASYVCAGPGAAGQCAMLLRPHGVGAPRAVLHLALASLVGFCGAMVWAPCGMALLQTPEAAHALPALGAGGPQLIMVATAVFGLGALMVLILLTLAPRLGAGARIITRFFADGSDIPILPSPSRLLALIPFAALAWVVGAGPLWLVVRAVAPQTGLSLQAAIGIQALATVAGSVTFFLPNGLGARDSAIIGLLVAMAGVSPPAAAAVAVLMRASDPVAKALIVAVIAVSGRIPAPVWRAPIRIAVRGACLIPVRRPSVP
jgi:hypothetical protein